MKAKLLVVCLCLALSEALAAPFRNLDFEEADLSQLTTNASGQVLGSIEALLPGWNLTLRSRPISTVFFGVPSGGAGIITNGFQDFQVQGRFAVLVESGGYSPEFPGLPYTTELSQVGEIPAGARELWYTGLITPPSLYINGEPAPLSSGYGHYDIEAFAGQTVELRFLLENGHDSQIMWGIDNIRFIPIPEPRSLLLWVLAGVAGCVIRITSRGWASRT